MKREELTRYLDNCWRQGVSGIIAQTACKWKDAPSAAPGRRRQRHAGAARCGRRPCADAILVHHGWFWRGEDGRVTGMRKRRLQTLLEHDINLIAYHLPLDGHPEFGNNAQLARRFGWTADGASASRTSAGWATWSTPDHRRGGRRRVAASCSGRRC
jgi:hypothetical protein